MKLTFIAVLSTLLLFAACRDNCEELTCPECYDSKMECIDGACTCPENSILLYHNLLNPTDADSLIDIPRQFCVQPNKLTFLASFEQFECIDTFAITFYEEPTMGIQNNLANKVIFEVPDYFANHPIVRGALVIDTTDQFVGIYGLSPTFGRESRCYYEDTSTNEFGLIDLDFRGNFVHPDTIRGMIEVSGISSTYVQDKLGSTIEVDLIRTIPY